MAQVDATAVYEITIDSEADLTGYEVDSMVVIGGIPFDYGIKWTDFSSPQYKHKVRQLQIDVSGFNGMLIIQHYKDLIELPTHITTHYIGDNDTKVISKNTVGHCNEYGFRVFGMSLTKMGFHSFEIVFNTEA